MSLAASGAPAAVKRRAVDPVHTVKIFPVVVFALLHNMFRLQLINGQDMNSIKAKLIFY
jgi:hypothetical protein